MSIRSLAELKSLFQTADQPDGADFVDLIDTLASRSGVSGATLIDGTVAVTKLTPGALLQKIRTNGSATTAEWYDDTQTSLVVNQVSHGFSTADAVYVTPSGLFLKAKANLASTGQCVGVVGAVVSPDVFVLVINGKVSASTGAWDALTGDTGGLVSGTVYYLSYTVAGGYSTIAPTNIGNTVQAVLLAISSASALVMQQPSVTVGANQISPESVSKAWVNFDGRADGSGVGTFTSANVITANPPTVNANSIDPTVDSFGMISAVRFTTTLTLPAPLAVLTTYYMRGIPASLVSPVLDKYTLHLTRADAENNTNIIDLTTGGTGTHTVTRLAKSHVTESALAAAVSTVNDTITVVAHRFASVQAVLLTTTSTLPAPLTTGTLYWIKSLDVDTVAFFANESDALIDNNRIDLTTIGIGTHTLDAGQLIRSSLNVDYVQRHQQGVYTLWFRIPFISGDYAANITISPSSLSGTDAPTDQDVQARINIMTARQLQIAVGYTSGGTTLTESSAEIVAVTAFGNQ